MSARTDIIPVIRQFNRFYTNILGLLDQHLLNSDFSLSEARVLYEIENTNNCTAKILIEKIRIDAGYLSRIIKRFAKLGLIYKTPSSDDGRSYFIRLTKSGQETLSRLDSLSREQISQIISPLTESEQVNVAQSMITIEAALSDHASPARSVCVRTDLKPGDVGRLIHLHGWIYAQECGYNHVFEGYVCRTFSDFLANYSPDKDRLWLAEAGGELAGAIAIAGRTAEKAQLRWFIIHPDYRGKGIGGTLLNEAIQFCTQAGYKSVFLETTEDQKTAIQMYKKAGFTKIAEHRNSAWGVNHVEETYELLL
ncbi:bifunctional helix-turn-helix transcriptional regulator/GNAT family N-acetyltransferase [Paenibacillus senegalensis]|uniref:bifunctional helix-turn-helix transcriptional regulator/GNAT family N-acetyltransferase n=1 Tax=Paenibacillus senegalensis TaxID=1465766 RepID=UPI0002880D21|nr:bifunctional helix-turn-helix transcriptional regulator/GNAT family N-acetyltransferase [Paenibacillus senegalensis]